MLKSLRHVATLALFALSLALFQAQPISAEELPSKLSVVIHRFEPCVMKTEYGWTGYDIELWEKVAKELKLDYTYKEVQSLSQLFSSVKDKSSQVGLAGATKTSEREFYVDFSHRTLDSGLSLMTRDSPASLSLVEVVKAAFDQNAFLLIFFYVLWPFLAGLVVVLKDKDFTYWQAFWLCFETATTCGFGKKHSEDRFVHGFQIVVIVVALVLTVFIGTVLTSNSIQYRKNGEITNITQLQGKRVATVRETTSQAYLFSLGMHPRVADNLEDLGKLLLNNEVDVIMFDTPALKFFAQKLDGQVYVHQRIFKRQDYGFVFPEDSPLHKRVNTVLQVLEENGFTDSLKAKYFNE